MCLRLPWRTAPGACHLGTGPIVLGLGPIVRMIPMLTGLRADGSSGSVQAGQLLEAMYFRGESGCGCRLPRMIGEAAVRWNGQQLVMKKGVKRCVVRLMQVSPSQRTTVKHGGKVLLRVVPRSRWRGSQSRRRSGSAAIADNGRALSCAPRTSPLGRERASWLLGARRHRDPLSASFYKNFSEARRGRRRCWHRPQVTDGMLRYMPPGPLSKGDTQPEWLSSPNGDGA